MVARFWTVEMVTGVEKKEEKRNEEREKKIRENERERKKKKIYITGQNIIK